MKRSHIIKRIVALLILAGIGTVAIILIYKKITEGPQSITDRSGASTVTKAPTSNTDRQAAETDPTVHLPTSITDRPEITTT